MCSSIYLVERKTEKNPFLKDRSFFFREDAFQKEDNSYNDIRFEEACIMYNLGAMYSRLGANESRRTNDVNKTKESSEQSLVFLLSRVLKMHVPIFDVPQHVMKKFAINTPPIHQILHRIY